MTGPVRITVDVPGSIEVNTVEVGEGTGVVLGRTPDPARAASEIGARVVTVPHALSSPSVSANHAAVWMQDGELRVRDLGSRNGTWVRLTPHATVALPAADAQLRLANGTARDRDEELPAAPRYRNREDYGGSVADAIRTWLERHDARARVWVAATAEANAPTGVVELRLITGELVLVQSEGTVDERFQGVMSQLARYVAAQNALYAAETETRDDGMILASPELRQVHRRVVELAMQGVPRVVIVGASGTGKERLARAFHRHGGAGPLVTINCASLGRERLVADLFGAEAGAYTGAQKTMVGAVERADGGTLFLDEVGDMPLEVQPQLLRFLDTGEYQRLGSIGATRTVNVKVVAATNLDLRRMVAEGKFRADLFFRLALEIVEIPPLRQRWQDVVAYLDSQLLGDVSVHDALTPKAFELLRHHRWEGNFRELVNLVRRLPRTSGRSSLDEVFVQRALDAGALAPTGDPTPPQVSSGAWSDCLRASLAAYTAGGTAEPSSWSEVVTFIEQYLKPHAMVQLAELRDQRSLEDVALGRVAERVKADRGTVLKQLRAYFDSKA